MSERVIAYSEVEDLIDTMDEFTKKLGNVLDAIKEKRATAENPVSTEKNPYYIDEIYRKGFKAGVDSAVLTKQVDAEYPKRILYSFTEHVMHNSNLLDDEQVAYCWNRLVESYLRG